MRYAILFVGVGLLLVFAIVYGEASRPSPSEYEALARLEVVRGENERRLIQVRNDVFKEQLILTAVILSIPCSFMFLLVAVWILYMTGFFDFIRGKSLVKE